MVRVLTKRFFASTIAKFEKQYKKTILDFISVDGLSVNVILTLMSMGNKDKTEDEVANILDEYMAEGNGIIDALIQVLDELDRDIHIFKGTGLSIKDIKEQYYKEIENNVNEEQKVVEFKAPEAPATELKPNESVKVDVNGFASLDTDETADF